MTRIMIQDFITIMRDPVERGKFFKDFIGGILILAGFCLTMWLFC